MTRPRAPYMAVQFCQYLLPLVFWSLRRCHGKKLFNVSLRALSNWSQMVSGDLILCAAQSTLQLFSTQLILNQVYYSVGDMNTPPILISTQLILQQVYLIVLEIWIHHGLVCVIIASHNIGQRACPASAQTSSVMMAPSSCSYMSTPLNLISYSFPRRGSLPFGDLHRQGKAHNILTHVSLKMFPTLVVA